jgi:2-hydroxy-6-oxonona-2,4-dienedioate hydrolase
MSTLTRPPGVRALPSETVTRNRPPFDPIWTTTTVSPLRRSLKIHSLRSRQDSGFGSPVVFVPGLGASSESMLPTARLLLQARDVYVLDLPGDGGESEPPDHNLDLAEYVAIGAAWLAALGLERATWIGHSFGSQVLVQLASDRPELVDRLVLISPTVDPRARTMPDQIARLLIDAGQEPPRLLRLLARDYLRAGFRRMLGIGRVALRDRVEQKLPLIQAPTLVVRGGKDPLVPERWAEEIANLLPHGQLVVIPHATHAVQFVAPTELAQAIGEFLSSPDSAPPVVSAAAVKTERFTTRPG